MTTTLLPLTMFAWASALSAFVLIGGVSGARGAASAAPRGGGMPFSLGADRSEWTGVVAERVPAGPYAYFRVAVEGGPERWAVTLGDGPTVGERVVVTVYATKEDFASKRLGRTFASLAFARAQPAAPERPQETP